MGSTPEMARGVFATAWRNGNANGTPPGNAASRQVLMPQQVTVVLRQPHQARLPACNGPRRRRKSALLSTLVPRAGAAMKDDRIIYTRARFLAALTAVVLVWAFTIAAIVPIAPSDVKSTPQWVRTADGWQRPAWRESPPLEPGLHPILPAVGIALLSVFWLVAFSDFQQPARATVAKIPPPHTPVKCQHARR